MKKSIGVLMIVVTAFVAGRFSPQLPVEAQGEVEPPGASCGDLNDDGSVGLTDAVYLLNHLFLGGPVPVCSGPSGGSVLLATGQRTCYDAEGNEILCDGGNCAGQDGFYRTGCSDEGRFLDNGNGTVTDNCTGLMWQQETADTDDSGAIDDGDRLNWCDALAYCESLDLAGHDDWRLPNIRELQSIADYGRFDPAINPVFGALSSFYWTSTTDVFGLAGPDGAKGVYFGEGSIGGSLKGWANPVRAVRTIQPGE